MAKGAYIGVNNVARKIKKGYIGVNNVARKIKKAYIGIGGIARPCWSGGEVAYYGKITSLSEAREFISSGSFANYAVFTCGMVSGGWSNKIDVYDKSLVHSNPTTFPYYMYGMGVATVGNSILFAGGYENRYCNTVYAYNSSFTLTTLYISEVRTDIAGTGISNYAIFVGGHTGGKHGCSRAVNAFNTSLTRTDTSLSYGTALGGASPVGDYAVFAGGYDHLGNGTAISTVTAFNNSLTKTTATSLSRQTTNIASTSVGNYALFGGGLWLSNGEQGYSDAVDAYNSSLTKYSATNMSSQRYYLAATSVGDVAMFVGGAGIGAANTPYNTNNVDAYDSSLTKKTMTQLTSGMYRHSAASVGDYALFGGGRNKTGILGTVLAYKSA